MTHRYDWHREAPPFAEPTLRFDHHFQNDGLPVPPDRHVLIAVSGGGDSVALLHLLSDWGNRSGCRLSVATVDHGLRDGSADEAAFVADICRSLALPHRTLMWRRETTCGRSSSAARGARYRLLHGEACRIGATCIALGHTRDDQAETITMRATRSGGTGGLAGMAVRTGLLQGGRRVDLFRPLLHISRRRLRAYLAANGHRWRDDPTNDDTAFERVRIRRRLEAGCAIGTGQRARFAHLCGRSRAVLSAAVGDHLHNHARTIDRTIVLTGHDTATAPVLHAALAAIVRRVGENVYPVSSAKLEPFLSAVRDRAVRCVLRRTLPAHVRWKVDHRRAGEAP